MTYETQLIVMACVLLPALGYAIYTDLLRHRITNVLSFGTLAIGIALMTFSTGFTGLQTALFGAAVGFAAFLPFYAVGGMGAGDVKLMAAVGSFLGPMDAFLAAAVSLLLGGVLAVGYVLYEYLRPSTALEKARIEGVSPSRMSLDELRRKRFPYAAAIASGTFTVLLTEGMLVPLASLLTGVH
jgi:prepilin peptidase CpaA